MTERPRIFDDLAGVAGGAMSALAGLRDEAESVMRARVDEAIRKFDLVRREDLEAVQEMAANARAGQQAAEARLAALEAKVAELVAGGVGAAPSPGPAVMPTGAAPAGKPTDGSEAGPGAMPPGSGMPGSTGTAQGA